MIEMHVGRNWSPPDPFAPECGCTVLPCGLVSTRDTNAETCDQHSALATRTIRIMHLATECPRLEQSNV